MFFLALIAIKQRIRKFKGINFVVLDGIYRELRTYVIISDAVFCKVLQIFNTIYFFFSRRNTNKKKEPTLYGFVDHAIRTTHIHC